MPRTPLATPTFSIKLLANNWLCARQSLHPLNSLSKSPQLQLPGGDICPQIAWTGIKWAAASFHQPKVTFRECKSWIKCGAFDLTEICIYSAGIESESKRKNSPKSAAPECGARRDREDYTCPGSVQYIWFGFNAELSFSEASCSHCEEDVIRNDAKPNEVVWFPLRTERRSAHRMMHALLRPIHTSSRHVFHPTRRLHSIRETYRCATTIISCFRDA